MRRPRISYSAEELAWIKARCDLPRAELHAQFVKAFDRPDLTVDHIKSLCSRNEWSAGPDGRRRGVGKSRTFTAEQITWLRTNATLPRNLVAAAFLAAFPDADTTTAKITSWRKRNKVTTGRTGQFKKGQVSPTKGKKGICAPGSEKGWFKKGSVSHTYRGHGHERIDTKDGYIVMIVDEPNPWTGGKTRPVHKHRWQWEQQHGPIPDGMCLKCLGDKTNTDPSNWELVPRGLLPRLNGKSGRNYDAAPAELKPLIMATAKLEHRARSLKKERKDHG